MSKSEEEPLNEKYGTGDEGDKNEKHNEEYVSNTQPMDEKLSENISKKKFCLICSALVLVFGGTAIGLAIHFTRASSAITIEPVVKDAVLALSTYSSNNVPMVIKLTSGIGLNGIWSNGESV